VRVTCERCGRKGPYRLESLIAERGPNASVPDWLHELTATCEIKQAQNWGVRSGRAANTLEYVTVRLTLCAAMWALTKSSNSCVGSR
jgi:hypothetical protein